MSLSEHLPHDAISLLEKPFVTISAPGASQRSRRPDASLAWRRRERCLRQVWSVPVSNYFVFKGLPLKGAITILLWNSSSATRMELILYGGTKHPSHGILCHALLVIQGRASFASRARSSSSRSSSSGASSSSRSRTGSSSSSRSSKLRSKLRS